MSKFLLIGSVAAMLYGDCAWGMGDDIDPWRSASTSSQIGDSSERDSANAEVRSRRNSRTFHQDAQTQTEQAQASSWQSEENRFIKTKIGVDSNNLGIFAYLQYNYVPSNNSKTGRATPTAVSTVAGDLKGWNDIAEIRYANDVSYDKLENPKVILYRNRDNSCYIILRIEENKHGVFYGTNERNIEVGRSSFAVYDLSEDVGSFTDSVARLIYVDESGLYFVPKAKNSVENVIDTYQKEGKFKFEGSVVKVSAIDGTITLNGKPVTKDNFFDNWVEFGQEVTVFNNGGSQQTTRIMTIPSTKQPNEKEVIRNFYPPNGLYEFIYSRSNSCALNTFTEIPEKDFGGYIKNLVGKKWMDYFVNRRILSEKSKSKKGCKELVKNDTFSRILRKSDHYSEKVRNAIATQVSTKGGKTKDCRGQLMTFSDLVSQNASLFKDPEFVKSLKPAFAELEKDLVHTKDFEVRIPLMIVGNL